MNDILIELLPLYSNMDSIRDFITADIFELPQSIVTHPRFHNLFKHLSTVANGYCGRHSGYSDFNDELTTLYQFIILFVSSSNFPQTLLGFLLTSMKKLMNAGFFPPAGSISNCYLLTRFIAYLSLLDDSNDLTPEHTRQIFDVIFKGLSILSQNPEDLPRSKVIIFDLIDVILTRLVHFFTNNGINITTEIDVEAAVVYLSYLGHRSMRSALSFAPFSPMERVQICRSIFDRFISPYYIKFLQSFDCHPLYQYKCPTDCLDHLGGIVLLVSSEIDKTAEVLSSNSPTVVMATFTRFQQEFVELISVENFFRKFVFAYLYYNQADFIQCFIDLCIRKYYIVLIVSS